MSRTATPRDVIEGRARWCVVEGDSLAVLPTLPDGCVDAVVTDPPYSSGGAMRGDRLMDRATKYQQTGTAREYPDFTGDTRDAIGFAYWEALWLARCMQASKPAAPVCVFTDWRQLAATTSAVQAGGWVFRGIAPWDKTEASRPVMGRFRSQCEYVVWGSNGPMPFDNGVGVLPGVFRVGVTQADKHHMTGKPSELMRCVVRICAPGGLILDPFAGSGSTGVGALLEGRRAILIERVPEYAEISRQRCEAAEQGIVTRRESQLALPGLEEA